MPFLLFTYSIYNVMYAVNMYGEVFSDSSPIFADRQYNHF